ncbi:hypothetical protein P4S95_01725 [Aneurinibacillus aneurinilyticus]|uniref:hypothetical protein n=1 Tax=Aneurinibacillus aneurinilyticus TaxID=1391 RepID=UPI002E1DB20F|nr:hypothetical protein [Aneurinibacillus aneurinilyticus]
MKFWQISKYKASDLPLYKEGKETTWTSISDIGKKFNGKIFTIQEYLSIEDLFIDAIKKFMVCSQTKYLFVNQVEKSFELDTLINNIKQKGLMNQYSKQMLDFFHLVKEGNKLNMKQIEIISRLSLREDMWTQLSSQSMFVRFDYDYYVDIGSTNNCEVTAKKISETGLVVNLWDEPYPFSSTH